MTHTEPGLPELPDGYFWRVYESSTHYARVALVYRRLWRWATEVDSIVLPKYELSAPQIQQAAEDLYGRNKVRATGGDKWKQFLGDYPPKSLLGSKTNAAEDAADKEETNGND